VNEYFRNAISAADVVWAYAGVRSLYDDANARPRMSAANMPHARRTSRGGADTDGLRRQDYDLPTPCGRRACKACALLSTHAGLDCAKPAAGRRLVYDGIETLVARTLRTWPFLAPEHARRLAHAYGTRVADVLKDVSAPADLGARFGADLTAAEVRYLMSNEWAQSADDVLWRRSKLGLRLTDAQCSTLDRFMTQP